MLTAANAVMAAINPPPILLMCWNIRFLGVLAGLFLQSERVIRLWIIANTSNIIAIVNKFFMNR